ncbi:conserved protein, unknown function [Hepatocystis sp. ex Piliocolobus tephrosceles]|nr:conserved protein, unknown function [Hepatocystis sp. ex Piliocolobus tephrosceles]
MKFGENCIYYENWYDSLVKKNKNKEIDLFMYGLYNLKNENDVIKKWKEEHETNIKDVSQLTNNISNYFYDKLCLGVRYFEMLIITKKEKQEGEKDKIKLGGEKKELFCLYAENNIIEINKILQAITVFLIKNKKEKLILSFLQNNDEIKELGNSDIYETVPIQQSTYNTNYNPNLIIEKLDIYMYVYLRNYLKKSKNSEDYNIIYFYNNMERVLDLSMYNYNVDNAQIRSWFFNNLPFLLSTSVLTNRNEQENEQGNEQGNDKKKKYLMLPGRGNNNSNNTKLSQEHHIALFRLNSMTNDTLVKSVSKIIIKKKLPNILLNQYNQEMFNNCYTFVNADYSLSGKSDNDANNTDLKYNCVRYYIKYLNKNYKNLTLNNLPYYDPNINKNKQFIGHNNLSLTEYVMDIPKDMHLKKSPFIFTNLKINYLSEEFFKQEKNNKFNNLLINNSFNNENLFFVVKIKNEQNINNILSYIHHKRNNKKKSVDCGKCLINILTTNYSVDIFFQILKINIERVMG